MKLNIEKRHRNMVIVETDYYGSIRVYTSFDVWKRKNPAIRDLYREVVCNDSRIDYYDNDICEYSLTLHQLEK